MWPVGGATGDLACFCRRQGDGRAEMSRVIGIDLGTTNSCVAVVDVQRYRDRVGDTGAVPRMAVDPSEITGFDLPADVGFMLSLLDGKTSIDELIALSGMDVFEALRILDELVAGGIAELES